ncbi:hypothetical protein CHS0354_012564 [Potamilus streckersoni]|uniref:Beta-lactamase-related domain-containing protein n=1 Tax=Potamilus streckersoni TaxID=2493646 RepID=A0AAE0SXL0_9BIVA|nr:hypothetical protein CHS0354_012564 [Potamilus streckersoni]
MFSYSQGHRIRHSRDKKGELSSIDFSEFESFVHHVLSCRNVPGAGIAMVKDNHVLYTEGFGLADIKSRKKATRHTKFCIGSLTKAFTSTLLARLLSQKDNIDWDTPIKDILKENFRLSDELRTNQVNLRDVLAHKVGIPENFHALLVGFSENVTREDFVRFV